MIQRCVEGKMHEAMVESERTGTSRLGENARTMLHMYCDNHIQRPLESAPLLIVLLHVSIERRNIRTAREGSTKEKDRQRRICVKQNFMGNSAYKNRMQPNE